MMKDGTQPYRPFADAAVEAVFDGYPAKRRARLMALREQIFETAAVTEGVGALEETLKWGQPAYLTPETKSGSTLRLGLPKGGGYGIYAHCQSTLISDFRGAFGDEFTYDGKRAVLFADDETPPEGPMRMLIAAALTYKLKR